MNQFIRNVLSRLSTVLVDNYVENSPDICKKSLRIGNLWR